MADLFKGIDALLITNPTNIRYLIGFVGVAEKEREAYLLITPDQTFLFTSSLYIEQARKLKALRIVEISQKEPFTKKLADVIKKGRLGFEETDLTVAEHNKLKKTLSGVKLVAIRNRIETLRQIKRDDEIKHIKEACRIADECFPYILKKIKPSVTESELAWKIESFIREKGAQLAFSPIVAFGKNSSQPHYIRTSVVRLQSSDIILLDFGARVNGYCSDMSRVMFVGKPKSEWVHAYQAVLRTQEKALSALQKGQRNGAKLDRASRQVIKEAKFPAYPHSLGHNIGLDIHELPRLSVKKDAVLKPGMVFSVEPGIYIEGHYGIRIEDLVLLKQDGIEILTTTPKEMIVL